MININAIIICPECKGELSKALKCETCGNQYSYRHGVYNLVSLKLSGEQDYLFRDKIPDDLNLLFSKEDEARLKEVTKDYYSRYNAETIEAETKQDEYISKLLKTLSGNVLDLATGGGTMLQKLIDTTNQYVSIICSDINEKELIVTRLRRNKSDYDINYVTTDGRYLSFKDNIFDYIISFAGFGNIPEGDKVAKEIYRVLKPNGKIIIQGGYIEKNTKSYELACSVGVERGVVEEYIMMDLKAAGFENIKSTVVAEAIWSENPYDLIPATGDIQRYCIIEAQRAK